MSDMERRMEIAQVAHSVLGGITANGDASIQELRSMDDDALMAVITRRAPSFTRLPADYWRVLLEEVRLLLTAA